MFRAHGARYCIKTQVQECTNLLWADLGTCYNAQRVPAAKKLFAEMSGR